MNAIVNAGFGPRDDVGDASRREGGGILRSLKLREAYISTRGAVMLLRLSSLISGFCSLYLAVIPLVTGLPHTRPLWLELLLWVSAICLIAAAVPRLEERSHLLALLGSGLVISAYACSWVITYLARTGHVHFEARIFAKPENWFDRWRIFLDRPVSDVLLFCSVLCFLLAVYRCSRIRLHPTGSEIPPA